MARSLILVEDDPEALARAGAEAAAQAGGVLTLAGDDLDRVADIAKRVEAQGREVQVRFAQVPAPADEAEARQGETSDRASQEADPADLEGACLLVHQDPAALGEALVGQADRASGSVLAPRGPHAWDARPLFLVSIPKAGTHLLYELAGAFGYTAGVECPPDPRPGTWYCVEYSNSHTVARDFFVDTVRRSPFGNRHHPFMTSPAVFIYRNPLDIWLSEANYYHRDGNTAFAGYLAHLTYEERLIRLADDPWLLGSIRDRIGGFLPWVDFGNVASVSFEELVGERGGGSRQAQEDLVWSLMLKLQVPGDPTTYAAKAFNPDSPTFHAGKIGGARGKLTDRARQAFAALPQDFMAALGYPAMGEGAEQATLPGRVDEFRRRPLRYASPGFPDTPIVVETDYLQFNLIRFQGFFYAIRVDQGDLDLTALPEAQRARLLRSPDLNHLRANVLFQRYPGGYPGPPRPLDEPGRRPPKGIRGALYRARGLDY